MSDPRLTISSGERWASRRLLAWTVRGIIFLTPIAVSVLVVLVASRSVTKPASTAGTVIWWIGITAAATLALRITERALRRFLPVVAFLRLSLVFPDKAPSRFRMAIRSGTVKQLQRRYEGGSLTSTTQAAAETLLTLSAQLNVHDRLTRGHSERVRAYSVLIAEEMGIPRHQRDLLQWAALLHDIGKLEMPTEILNKRGSPTEEEWNIIKAHPANAQVHLEPLSEWLGEWRHAATQHHERWEGGGYPAGLHGSEISLAGRIVAVADAYDTITSVRSYKQACSPEDGRAEIARSAGTHFDPAVVKAFLAVSGARTQKVLGPLSWLAQAPILASVPTVAVPTLTSAMTATAAMTSMTFAGVVMPPAPEPIDPVGVDVPVELPFTEMDRPGAIATPTTVPQPANASAQTTPESGPTITFNFPESTATPEGFRLTFPTPDPYYAGPAPQQTPTPTPAPGSSPEPTPTGTPSVTRAPTTTPTPAVSPSPSPSTSPPPPSSPTPAPTPDCKSNASDNGKENGKSSCKGKKK